MSNEKSKNGFVKPVLVSVVSTLAASGIVWLLGFRQDSQAVIPGPQRVGARPSATATERDVATTAGASSPASPASVDGVWYGSDGLTYHVRQLEGRLTVRATQLGVTKLEGAGTLSGGTAVIEYHRDGLPGVAQLQLAPDGRSFAGAFNTAGIVGEILLRR